LALPRHPAFATLPALGEKTNMRFASFAALFGTNVVSASPTPLASQEALTMSVLPVVSQDHAALISSPDPQLPANQRLVYDMYRIVLQAGLADRAHEFIADDYIQHNPNAGQGLAGLVDYVRATRPERPIKDVLDLPLIHLMAEGDYVTTAFVRPE